ncbi:MAG: hypothetical protein AAFN43_10550 [Pseudomonadota bacterium]
MQANENFTLTTPETSVFELSEHSETIDEKLMQTAAALLVRISQAAESFVDQEVTQ